VIEATWLGEKVDRNHDSTLKDQMFVPRISHQVPVSPKIFSS
jgi:hypothetical protein